MSRRGGWTAALLAAALSAGTAPAARGGFADGHASAAADGAGDAYVARADGADALFINPAGLARLDRGEMSFLYARPLEGLSGISLQQGTLAVGLPVGEGGAFAAGGRVFDNAGLSREYEALLGAAMRLGGRTSAGVAAGFLRRDYDLGGVEGAAGDPVFSQGTSKGAVGVDAGLLTSPWDGFSLGASVRHANRPDLGLASEDRVPMTWRAGAAWRLGRLAFLGEARGRSAAGGSASRWGAGLEWSAFSPLVLRAGAEDGRVAGGVGLAYRDLRLDYAFAFLQDAGADGAAASHRLAVGVRFGAPRDGSPLPRSVPTATRPANPRPPVRGDVSTGDSRAYPVYRKESENKQKRRPPRRIRPAY